MLVYKIWFLLCFRYYVIYSQVTIPETLKECYINRTKNEMLLPLNLRTFIDILRKAETETFTTMDIRTFSSSLLHRFKFDGVEYIEGLHETEGILPFIASGTQRTKNRIIEELVPGDADAFPSKILSQIERCTLHFAISNTVNEYKSKNTNSMCQEIGNREKLTGRTISINAIDCPREYGVILTPYGTIAPGAVIGAIAASLQHQNVILNQLLASPAVTFTNVNYNEDQIDLIIPKDQLINERSMWQQSINTSQMSIDNVWLTTIAGDLGEMAIYQGPLVEERMTLGVTGFWNSTIYPNIYYLTKNPDSYDATRAEIVGDIDGLILAHNLQTWIDNFNSLRLSQIFDMYYSDQGINFDSNIKACNRKLAFTQVTSKTILREQTHAVSYLLAYRNSVAYISDEALKRLINYAVDIFTNYTEKHLLTESHCYNKNIQLQAEVIIVFDGAWTPDYTKDFISVLLEDLDVSIYGSKMGILHGSTGNWLLNVTNSPSFAYETIYNFTKVSWPSQLNYTKTLQTIFTYLNITLQENQKNHVIGNLGQVIILLVPLAYMTDTEIRSALMLLQQIKLYYPDVHFLYYTSEYNAYLFQSFIISKEDHLIKTLQIDDIIEYFNTVSWLLRPLPNINTNTENYKNQMENYVAPSQSILYKLHSHWRKNTRKTAVTFHNVGYGEIKVCSWNQVNDVEKKYNEYCKDASGHKDIILTDYTFCPENKLCPDIYYRVQNVTSLRKCTELECKTPDHVRYIVRIENTYYRSGANRDIITTILSTWIFPLFIIFK
ncbi:uncharacterized protein LOC118445508 isoform X1 [Vespa mandarinia]|uniref:uncharacterized protein LOC118445508 isoform X1 n=3 Tax=Vespa mandarinia TaxID=7446 RepID=UPI001616C0A7|nr:uncharacterized protein LOC118445508 isoform X1 [Vespa mandarinia]